MSNLPSPIEDNAVEQVAVIGMAGRFPGAKNIEAFWQNLRNGIDAVSKFSDEELRSLAVPEDVRNHRSYVKAGMILEDTELFDADFFNYTPKAAEVIDPQQRIFLETAWHAVEDAGYNVESYTDPIGVFAGVSPNQYANLFRSNPTNGDAAGAFETLISNDKDFLATRVAYKLNLKGPGITIQTACSTSLVAVHLACQSLLTYQCSMALAGGVCVNPQLKGGYFYQEGMILSPDGHCRAFDAKAQGTVMGQGVDIVVLKRLSDAIADGDTILAVIKGSAINNDGSSKVSYTAPSVDGQAEVILQAQAISGVSANTIGYIEAHGTGTSLGDPVEVAALTEAFRATTDKKGFCAIGSVKTNIGHLDAAAGVAGLIKTILALKHREIPPTLHFEKPNPNIDFDNSPFYVNAKLRPWESNGALRRAGVSAFGIGGTNAHVVLEEAPLVQTSEPARRQHLLTISARTSPALDQATNRLVEHLKQYPDSDFANIAYTLQVGRKSFDHRRIVVCHDAKDAITALETLDSKRVHTAYQGSPQQDIVFMFSGQGSQYVNMGRDLYHHEPNFKEWFDRCSEILQSHLELDLRDVVYPNNSSGDDAAHRLEQTFITQPALFAIEYASAKLWMAWGIQPWAFIGHSIGEYVAACLAGVVSLEDALSLVAIRGRLMQDMPAGSMLAVPLSEQEIQPLLSERLSVAAVNSPRTCVVSGESDAVAELEKRLGAKDLTCRRLHTSHAFHSAMMDPVLDQFTRHVKKVHLTAPQIPFVSNVTGTWITPDEATDPDYWAMHLRRTVRFADCVEALAADPKRVFLEIGPGNTLSKLTRQHPDISREHVVLPSIRQPNDKQPDDAFALTTLGRLWLAGVQPDWSGFYGSERRRRVSLPTYPFERQRYWVTPDVKPIDGALPSLPETSLPQSKNDIANWFYVPSWKRSVIKAPLLTEPLLHGTWLVFLNNCSVGAQLVKRLEQQGQHVITATVGGQFAQLTDRAYTLNPQKEDGYDALFSELRKQNKMPSTIIHLWNTQNDDEETSGLESLDKDQDVGLYSLIGIARALGKQDFSGKLRIDLISNNLHDVTGEEQLRPEQATLLGPCKVIPLEYPTITCRNIDTIVAKTGSGQEKELIEQLVAELNSDTSDPIIAYRGRHRWIPTVEPVRIENTPQTTERLTDGGVYLIAGGLGGIGLVLAEHLARTVRAKLILTGRSIFPAQGDWDQWLANHDEEDEISVKIRKLQTIASLGGEALVIKADVANLKEMSDAVAQAEEHFGQVNGVIHAAGVIDNAGGIARRTRETIESTIASKVRGTLVLDNVFKHTKLDFFVLFSSVSTALYHNRFGQVGYVAANSFLDTYAYSKTLRDGTFTVTINWDDWQEVGMTVRAEREFAKTYGIHDRILDPLDSFSPSDGVTLFERILSSTFARVLISTRDLRLRIELDVDAKSPFLESAVNAKLSTSSHPRPDMPISYVAPRSQYEQTIATIWQELLGIEKIGVRDDYFELGGDSLRAAQVLSRLSETLQVELSLNDLFEKPTIAGIAERVETLGLVRQGADDIGGQSAATFVEGEL